jgi:hypothetical protein
MADDAAAAVRALRRQGLDGTLKAIKNVRPAIEVDFKALSYSLPKTHR